MAMQDIFEKLKAILVDTFELEPDEITLSSNLYEDLDLDSIDAVDLIVKVQEYVGKRVQPDDFKSARTVDDVVKIIESMIDK